MNAADGKGRKDDDLKCKFGYKPVEYRLVAVIKNPLTLQHLDEDNQDEENSN